MRKLTGLLVFLGLVAASLLIRSSEPRPPTETPLPAESPATGAITGIVTRNGFPVSARIEVRKIRDLVPDACVHREWRHPFRGLHRPVVGSGDPVGTAESGPDGVFRVDGLPVAEYHITTRTADGATGQWKCSVVAQGEVLRESLDILPTVRNLLGCFRWSDGRPFVGQVSIGPFGTETAADGRFVLSDLPRHEMPIRAHIPGSFSRVVAYYDPDGRERLDLVVDEGLVWREGRVVSADDGRPLGGVLAGAFWREEPRRDGESGTRTAPDGTFRVLAHPDASTFAAVSDEHHREWVRDARFGVPVLIRLGGRPVVTGRVVTPAGVPVPGAPVWLFRLPVRSPGVPDVRWRTPVVSDANGRFRFTADFAGFALVAAIGGGTISRDLSFLGPSAYHPLAIDLSADEVIDTELVVVPSPSIVGRVTDRAGRPVVGIRVDASEDLEHVHPTRRWNDYLEEDPHAVTDVDGAYRIETIPPGTGWTMDAYDPRAGWVYSEPVRPDGSETVDLVLPATPSRRVQVRVLSAVDGRPIPEAWVETQPDGEEYVAPHRAGDTGTTGPDGRVLLGPFPDGVVVVSVRHPDHVAEAGIPVLLEEGGDPTVTLDVRLRPGFVLAGRVLMPDGSPAAFSNVIIGYRYESLGSSGRFVFRNLRKEVYEVRAWAGYSGRRYQSAEVRAETGREELVLTLEPDEPGGGPPTREPGGKLRPTGPIAGRVLDANDTPVRGAQVYLQSADDREPFATTGPRTMVWTDAGGRFRFAATVGVLHVLHVTGPPHLFQREAVPVDVGDETVVIRLAAAAEPVITVLDPSGTPLPGVAVDLVGSAIGEWDEDRCAVSDARGRARFGGLDPERALGISLTLPEAREDLLAPEIDDGVPADRTIHLRRLRILRGVVRDRDGFPIAYASLWYRAVGEDQDFSKVHVSGEGRWDVEDAPPGAIELRVGPPSAKPEDATLALVPVPAGRDEVEIEIDGGTFIGLAVPDWPADAKVTVSLTWRGGARRLTMPPSGRIRFHAVPDRKSFSIHAGSLPDGRMAHRGDLAAGRDHVIPLAPGAVISGKIIAPEPVELYHMSVYGTGIALRYQLDEDTPTDRYRVEGLPEGEYLFTILARSGRRRYKGEVDVRTGESTDIELEPWKD